MLIYMKALILCLVLLLARAQDPGVKDKIQPPGYPQNAPNVYSNDLIMNPEKEKAQQLRTIHYTFIESPSNPQNKPVTLWMNGGPGCSSMLGFLQEIGPYFLKINANYSGQNLTTNDYPWSSLSNLLFLDSPSGVGLSFNQDPDFVYNDANTAEDNLRALISFFLDKFPSYQSSDFFIAGESYAGKYIPDLALRIHAHNQNAEEKINLKGILIGNGVIDFSEGSLEKSVIEFYFSHNLIDPTLEPYWSNSCLKDEESAGCAYFYKRVDEILYKTNPYNIYYPCVDDTRPSQRILIREIMKYSKFTKKNDFSSPTALEGSCENLKGVESYFKNNLKVFNSAAMDFQVCNASIFGKYERTLSGSLFQIPRVLMETPYRIYLFNGDFDSVVPFTDTMKNLEKMSFRQSGPPQSWVSERTKQNIGLKRTYYYQDKKLKFWTVKGAGHEVPQYQRETAYLLFQSFLANKE